MAIDRIEVLVTDLTARVQREISSGAYDTGASGTLLGKPVLVKIHADGVTGYGQIRSISPGHFMPDTVHSAHARDELWPRPATYARRRFTRRALASWIALRGALRSTRFAPKVVSDGRVGNPDIGDS